MRLLFCPKQETDAQSSVIEICQFRNLLRSAATGFFNPQNQE